MINITTSDDGDYRYVLFDCITFFSEHCKFKGKVISIEGFELTDDRINLYIDFANRKQYNVYEIKVCIFVMEYMLNIVCH